MEHISLCLLLLGTFVFGFLALGYGLIEDNYKKGFLFALLSIACVSINFYIH